MSTQSYANQDFADQAHDELQAEQDRKRAEATDAAQTRSELEAPSDPEPNDDAPETAGESEKQAFTMTKDRRVGSMAVPIEGHGNVRFGKPSGRASMGMLDPIETMDDEEDAVAELGGYIWPTLADWSLEDEYDVDFFADELGLIDAIAALRSVALGGNPQEM